MRRLISPFILGKLADDEHHGSLEAATLFADVAGFTAMTSALMAHGRYGAEVGAEVMSTLFTPLVEAVYAHDGFITVFAGDAFTAVFPAAGPVVDEPCAMRSVAAAEAMRRHLQDRSQYDTPLGRFQVGVKIALAAGSVQWGIVRQQPTGRAAFYFRGSAINGCSSADAYNSPGGLVLHPSCRSLLRDVGTSVEIEDGFARLESVHVTLPTPHAVDLPPVDPQALSAFLSPEIAEQTAVGEYRNVVNVFVNLRGDPDDGALRTITGLIWDMQASYGGQLCRIDFGDKGCNLLLFWGAPVSYENDVTRALHFVLDLQRDAPMPLRAAVTTGISVAGFVGSDLHAEFTCFGEGVNLAARLMSAAPWGEIWLDEAVRSRAAARFVTRSVGDRQLKGFASPQPVFGLVDRRVEVERPDRRDLVGREVELQALAEFVAPLHEGHFAGVLVVSGEAGIGKSQLVSEFLEVVDATTATTGTPEDRPRLRALLAPSDAIARRPFNPFRYWLRNYFSYNPRAPERDNRYVFDERLDALIADLPDGSLRDDLTRARSMLGALVDVYWDGSLYAQLDPRGRYDSTLDAITHLLLAESQRQPVVLVLEDVHWIDEGSAEVVRRLVHAAADEFDGRASAPDQEGAPTFPIAVIATSRPADESPFADDVDLQALTVSPFGRRELETLTILVLGLPPTPELLDLLVTRTDGNPFFAGQLLHYLSDEAKLLRAGEHWTVNRAALADTSLPVDVKVIFVAQLDRLGRAAREVVQAASVLGREFNHNELFELLRRSGVGHAAIPPAIAAGHAAGIWHAIGPGRHSFRHILLRDAAYDMQMRARLAVLHHRAALSVEQVWADNLAPHFGDLSQHFESACLLGVEAARLPAVETLGKAGEQAATTYASAAAADLFSRALALTTDDEVERRFGLLLHRDRVHDLRGDRLAQAEDVVALETLARQIGRPALEAEAAMRRAYLTGDTADFAGAMAASEQTVLLAIEAGLPALESTALRTGGAALRAMARFDEASERFEQAIDVAHAAQLVYEEATGWTAWSSISVRRGRWPEAVAALERVVTTFEGMGRVVRVAHALSELGLALTAGGRLAEAEAQFMRALGLARDVGDRAEQVRALSGLPLVLIARGDFRGADAAAAEAIELADQVRNSYMRTRAWMARGRAAMLCGDPAADGLLADAYRSACDEFPDLRAWVLAHRAALSLLDGRNADALTLATESVALARAVDDRLDLVLATLYRSLADEALGHLAPAANGFRDVIEIESAMDAVAGRAWDGQAGLARLALASGRLAEAMEIVEPIVAHLRAWHGAGEPGHGLSLCEQPIRVYQTAVQVLTAAGDDRAERILDRAVTLLTGWAERFDEPAARDQVLVGIPYHAEVMQAWQNRAAT